MCVTCSAEHRSGTFAFVAVEMCWSSQHVWGCARFACSPIACRRSASRQLTAWAVECVWTRHKSGRTSAITLAHHRRHHASHRWGLRTLETPLCRASCIRIVLLAQHLLFRGGLLHRSTK